MIFINHAEKAGLSQESYEVFLRLLAPFAPHLTEELWYATGKDTSIHEAVWPVADPQLLTDDTVTIGVQINGKMRGTVTVATDAEEETVLETIRADAGLAARLTSELKRVIFIRNKIINLIL